MRPPQSSAAHAADPHVRRGRPRRSTAAGGGLPLALFATLFVCAGIDAPARAAAVAPGAALLAAAETAVAVVAAAVVEVRQLDATGYVADLDIERTLSGEHLARRTVAWEEASPARPPRWTAGDRIVVALEDAPDNSLWRRRRTAGAGAWIIAAAGYAYVRAPNVAALDALAAYLELDAEKGSSAAGSAALTNLAAHAPPAVGVTALARLQSPASALSPAVVASLTEIAADEGHDAEVRAAALQVIARRRLLEARATVEQIAAREGAARVAALDALAELDGVLADTTVAALLASDRPRERAAGARLAGPRTAERQLLATARGDEDAGVRAAALTRLAATNTSWGLAATVDGLADPAAEVRAAAARAIAAIGEPALPALDRAVALAGATAPGAIATLSLMGPTAGNRVAEIARSHPDEHLRALALLALGHVRDEHAQDGD